jgi:hypothetical protein
MKRRFYMKQSGYLLAVCLHSVEPLERVAF